MGRTSGEENKQYMFYYNNIMVSPETRKEQGDVLDIRWDYEIIVSKIASTTSTRVANNR